MGTLYSSLRWPCFAGSVARHCVFHRCCDTRSSSRVLISMLCDDTGETFGGGGGSLFVQGPCMAIRCSLRAQGVPRVMRVHAHDSRVLVRCSAKERRKVTQARQEQEVGVIARAARQA